MEVPDLVRNALGGEEIEASVNLGDEDTVYLTGTRTLLYRAEGLLSDEKVEEYPHEVEQLDLKEGRRKTKFILEYVDGTRKFTVPSNRDDQVLELLLTGVLRAAGVTDTEETLSGVFRFSELALIVTESSVVKHIGAAVWTEDFEVYAFTDLTYLSFDRGSVATEIVIEIDGHPKRIKTPNEHARKVQQVVENAVFQYYGVSSLDQLNAEIAQDDGSEDTADTESASTHGQSDIEIGEGIDPLVTESDESDDTGTTDTSSAASTATSQPQSPTDQSRDEANTASSTSESAGATASKSKRPTSGQASQTNRSGSDSTDASSKQGSLESDVAEIEDRLDNLAAVVKRQNELLEQQQATIDQLVAELREGRG